MKKLLGILLLGLVLTGLFGCGEASSDAFAEWPMTAAENPWRITTEKIDLDKPKNRKYIDWAREDRAGINWRAGPLAPRTYSTPKYFDTEPYLGQANVEPYPISWNETMELVVENTRTSEFGGYTELLVRDKATGETKKIAKGSFSDCDNIVFDVHEILSDTRFLYSQWYVDGGGPWYYLYDLNVGGSIGVAGIDNYDRETLCDLGDGRYLWNNRDRYEGDERGLYLIDMSAFEAGGKSARRMLVPWSEQDSGSILHLSSDKRFVYMELYQGFDHTWRRAVYDVETGEPVALFELPGNAVGAPENSVLMGDDLEYVYNWGGSMDDPTIYSFCIIRYDMEPVL